MRHLRHYLLSLLCCALLLGAFSVSASAEEISVPPYHVYGVFSMERTNGVTNSLGSSIWYPNNGEFEPDETEMSKNFKFYNNTTFNSVYHFGTDDDIAFTKGNGTIKVTFENVTTVRAKFYNSVDEIGRIYSTNIISASLIARYTDGTWVSVPLDTVVKDTEKINVSGSFTPSKDVEQFELSVTSTLNIATYQEVLKDDNSAQISLYCAEEFGDNSFLLSIDQESTEESLLTGITGKLTDVWNTLKNGFTDLVNGITELPAKIWEFIENGLKNLFVPDEDFIVGYKDKWTDLLSDRLGAVWQVTEITFESWEQIEVSDAKNSIDMPKVTLNLPDNNEFSFGGFEVKIVPDGFDFLATSVKLIVSILCSLLFINGIRKRYDEVMGVET